MTRGYLVVLMDVGASTPYRGIDRVPPWDIEAVRQGFVDPYLTDPRSDENDLFPTLPVAEVALARFEGYFGNRFEIILVDTSSEPEERVTPNLLGYDVAQGGSPFVSPLVATSDRRALLDVDGRLNSNGLFDDYSEAARACAELKGAWNSHFKDATVWRIFALSASPDPYRSKPE